MGAKQYADSLSGNAIAELTGSELPHEVVVIGGHIDSWDVGDGASDDGAGCLMAMEAAAMLKELGLIPKRTIRVVLFTNEENGLRGATEYWKKYASLDRHIAGIESDAGAGAPEGLGVAGAGQGLLPVLQGAQTPVRASGPAVDRRAAVVSGGHLPHARRRRPRNRDAPRRQPLL